MLTLCVIKYIKMYENLNKFDEQKCKKITYICLGGLER